MRVGAILGLISFAGAGQDWYFFTNIPVKWVRIVGIVVAIEDFNTRRFYIIDDSSGACIQAKVTGKYVTGKSNGQKDSTSLQRTEKGTPGLYDAPKEQAIIGGAVQIEFPYDVSVGAVVDIKGSIATYWEEKHIQIQKLLPVQSTMQEVALWEKRTKFYADVLSKPWVLSPEIVRKCLRRAERSEEQTRERKQGPRGRAQAHKEPARQDEQSNKTQDDVKPGKHDKRRYTALQRSELAKMIHSEGVKGKFSALGL